MIIVLLNLFAEVVRVLDYGLMKLSFFLIAVGFTRFQASVNIIVTKS